MAREAVNRIKTGPSPSQIQPSCRWNRLYECCRALLLRESGPTKNGYPEGGSFVAGSPFPIAGRAPFVRVSLMLVLAKRTIVGVFWSIGGPRGLHTGTACGPGGRRQRNGVDNLPTLLPRLALNPIPSHRRRSVPSSSTFITGHNDDGGGVVITASCPTKGPDPAHSLCTCSTPIPWRIRS
jgi:hypothetical protein